MVNRGSDTKTAADHASSPIFDQRLSSAKSQNPGNLSCWKRTDISNLPDLLRFPSRVRLPND